MTPQHPKPEDVERLDWGSTPNVTRLGSLYFAGQLDAGGLVQAKESGVELVIDLRGTGEHEWDEAAAAAALGLPYASVPVVGAAFDPQAFANIERLVAAHADTKILIHCASSNRVGGWLATHLVEKKGMHLGEALAIGRAAGLTSSATEARVREYLASRPVQPRRPG